MTTHPNAKALRGNQVKSVRQVDIAYMAGFLDGEGTCGISVSKSTRGYHIPAVRVSFSNYNESAILWVAHRWGGSVNLQKTEVWVVTLNGKEAVKLLRMAMPYLIIKKAAARAAVRFQLLPFISPDEDPDAFIEKTEAALAVMLETRKGYKAIRGTMMMDKLKEDINVVKRNVALARTA